MGSAREGEAHRGGAPLHGGRRAQPGARIVTAAGRSRPSTSEFLLRASETLTSELVLDRLLEKLMPICIEAAAAERAVLVLDEDGPVVRAVGERRRRRHVAADPARRERLPLRRASSSRSCARARRSSSRTRSRDARFANDPYVARAGVRSVAGGPAAQAGPRRRGPLLREQPRDGRVHAGARRGVSASLRADGHRPREQPPVRGAPARRGGADPARERERGALASRSTTSRCSPRSARSSCPSSRTGASSTWSRAAASCPAAARHADSEQAAPRRGAPPSGSRGRGLAAATGASAALAEAAARPGGHPGLPARRRPRRGAPPAHRGARAPVAARAAARGARPRASASSRSCGAGDERRSGSPTSRVAEELARRAALAVDNARLHRDQRERNRHLRMIFRQAPGTIWATDRGLKFTHVAGNVLNAPELDVRKLLGNERPRLRRHPRSEPSPASRITWQRSRVSPSRSSTSTATAGTRSRSSRCGTRNAGSSAASERPSTSRSGARPPSASRAARRGSPRRSAWRTSAASSGTSRATSSRGRTSSIGSTALEPGRFGGTYEAFLEHVHPDDLEYTKAVVFDAYRNVKPFEYDHRIVRAGRERARPSTRAATSSPTSAGSPSGWSAAAGT